MVPNDVEVAAHARHVLLGHDGPGDPPPPGQKTRTREPGAAHQWIASTNQHAMLRQARGMAHMGRHVPSKAGGNGPETTSKLLYMTKVA